MALLTKAEHFLQKVNNNNKDNNNDDDGNGNDDNNSNNNNHYFNRVAHFSPEFRAIQRNDTWSHGCQ